MKALKLIGVLLDYPAETLWEHREELLEACADDGQEPKCRGRFCASCARGTCTSLCCEGDGWPRATETLPALRRGQLAEFVAGLLDLDPMQAQERWLGLFDRGRSMSLLLFEHIHGESRDRGQAMVDLIETYRKNGFELASKELPDYLPLVLEYLARRPAGEVTDWLKHTGPILELLAARAAERQSPYALLFELLIELSQGHVDLGLMRQRVASEPRDDTAEAMDQVWEEEAVRFGNEAPAENCAPPRRLPGGVQIAEPAAPAHRAPAATAGSAEPLALGTTPECREGQGARERPHPCASKVMP